MQSTFLNRFSRLILVFAILTVAFMTARLLGKGSTMSALEAAPQTLAPDGVRAPEFPSGAQWLNTDKPLSLRALRGKIVLLDFWTYGCINCMHILPDLKKLERKYPNELVVISVHSAKFENEQDAGNIRNALLRYNIEHPVLVDKGMQVWSAYAVRAWPTQVLIDPTGRIVGQVAGEGNYDIVNRTIAQVAQKFKASGQLDVTPAKFALEAARVQKTPLWYPGKVLADDASGHLFIADSNHNRIVIARVDGTVQAVAGSGAVGLKDGAFDEATFANPQGMALRQMPGGDLMLLVADTNNHAIRALDLKRGTVTTIAGNGRQAAWKSTGGVGTDAKLASPWDLLRVGSTLFIAMAGPHQIWKLDLNNQRVGPYAGSGKEARLDGTLTDSAFAQPSGLATDGQRLFVADSESNIIRTVDLPGRGVQVRTLAGGDLFDFGDVDGSGDAVRLQHPLGTAFKDGVLYIADTYNHKIKTLDPETGRVQTFLGDGRGNRDGAQPQFYEPGGISISGNKLYVADTNNHTIRVVDLENKTVATLTLKNLPVPLPAERERMPQTDNAEEGTVTLPVTNLAPDTNGELLLDVKLPALHHLNRESPQRFFARVEGAGLKLSQTSVPAAQFKLPLRVPFATGAAGTSGTVVVSATIFYCTDGKGAVCKFQSLRFRALFVVQEGGATRLMLEEALR